MAIVIQHPGSSGSYAMGALSQISSGYLEGKKAQAEAKKAEAQNKYYEELGLKTEAEKEKIEQETAAKKTREEERAKIFADIATPSGDTTRTYDTPAAPDPFGVTKKSSPAWLSGFGDVDQDPVVRAGAYGSEANAEFRAEIEKMGATIEGVERHPLVRRALEGTPRLKALRLTSELLNATKEDIAAYKTAASTYSGNLRSAYARAHQDIYDYEEAKFNLVLDRVEDPAMFDLTAAFKDRAEEIKAEGSKKGLGAAQIYGELTDAVSDYHEMMAGWQLESAYKKQFNSWVGNAEVYQTILQNMETAQGYDEDQAKTAMSILRGETRPFGQEDFTNSNKENKWGEYMRELGTAYDMASIAKQGQSAKWIPNSIARNQMEALGNLMQAQSEAWTGLMERHHADDPSARSFILETHRLYRDAPGTEGLNEEEAHAVRLKYAMDQQDAAALKEGKQGIPDRGYAWVFRQLKGETLPDAPSPAGAGADAPGPGKPVETPRKLTKQERSDDEFLKEVAEDVPLRATAFAKGPVNSEARRLNKALDEAYKTWHEAGRGKDADELVNYIFRKHGYNPESAKDTWKWKTRIKRGKYRGAEEFMKHGEQDTWEAEWIEGLMVGVTSRSQAPPFKVEMDKALKKYYMADKGEGERRLARGKFMKWVKSDTGSEAAYESFAKYADDEKGHLGYASDEELTLWIRAKAAGLKLPVFAGPEGAKQAEQDGVAVVPDYIMGRDTEGIGRSYLVADKERFDMYRSHLADEKATKDAPAANVQALEEVRKGISPREGRGGITAHEAKVFLGLVQKPSESEEEFQKRVQEGFAASEAGDPYMRDVEPKGAKQDALDTFEPGRVHHAPDTTKKIWKASDHPGKPSPPRGKKYGRYIRGRWVGEPIPASLK